MDKFDPINKFDPIICDHIKQRLLYLKVILIQKLNIIQNIFQFQGSIKIYKLPLPKDLDDHTVMGFDPQFGFFQVRLGLG